jgi:hypothetical protein
MGARYLGLNPLLVCLSYPSEQVNQRGVDNLSALVKLGFDVVVSASAPSPWRNLNGIEFKANNELSRAEQDRYITIVKGWP